MCAQVRRSFINCQVTDVSCHLFSEQTLLWISSQSQLSLSRTNQKTLPAFQSESFHYNTIIITTRLNTWRTCRNLTNEKRVYTRNRQPRPAWLYIFWTLVIKIVSWIVRWIKKNVFTFSFFLFLFTLFSFFCVY
jgi:hypothetical protein